MENQGNIVVANRNLGISVIKNTATFAEYLAKVSQDGFPVNEAELLEVYNTYKAIPDPAPITRKENKQRSSPIEGGE